MDSNLLTSPIQSSGGGGPPNNYHHQYNYFNMVVTPTASMPVDLRDILVKLHFLSLIQRGNKINTNNMSFVDADSLWGALIRTYQQENRRATLTFVNGIIDQTIDIINKYNNTVYIEIIINSLNSARIGIQNLADTYRSDPKTVSKISVYLENVDIQLRKYQSIIKGNQYLDRFPGTNYNPSPNVNPGPNLGKNGENGEIKENKDVKENKNKHNKKNGSPSKTRSDL